MTHDLLRNLLADLTVQVQRVVVTGLVDGTFYAEIQMTQDGESIVTSSRPSDAIALAVRATVPIFVEDSVMDEAGIQIEDEEEAEVEQFKEFLDQVSPEDFR